MKRTGFLIISALLMLLSACSTETIITKTVTITPPTVTVTVTQTPTSTPIPTTSVPPATGGEAPDDIMVTPFGPTYRANFHQEGVENPWLPIETIEVVLGDDVDAAHVWYRDYIETKAGETRNNIFRIITPDWDIQSLNLYASDIPTGIEIAERERWHGPRTIAPVLIISISQDVEIGQYNFEIKLEIDGKDYGSVPCIIKIIE